VGFILFGSHYCIYPSSCGLTTGGTKTAAQKPVGALTTTPNLNQALTSSCCLSACLTPAPAGAPGAAE